MLKWPIPTLETPPPPAFYSVVNGNEVAGRRSDHSDPPNARR